MSRGVLSDNGSALRVLSDNGSALRSHWWRDTCAKLEIGRKDTRPHRPPTNNKIERLHRTFADGGAYARCYTDDAQRRGLVSGCLHNSTALSLRERGTDS